MIEVLEQDLPKIKGMMNKLASMLGDEVRELDFVQQQELKGKIEGRLEAARKMIAKGFEDTLIAELTGLSVEDIQALRQH